MFAIQASDSCLLLVLTASLSPPNFKATLESMSFPRNYDYLIVKYSQHLIHFRNANVILPQPVTNQTGRFIQLVCHFVCPNTL